jgi:hypothetical protein
MKKKDRGIIAFGYVKRDGQVYTAICVNMNLFGQGKTPEVALKKVLQAVVSYVGYILENHPDDCAKFLNRPAPQDYLEEFERGLEELKKLKSQPCPPKQRYHIPIPVINFAQNVSFAQAR